MIIPDAITKKKFSSLKNVDSCSLGGDFGLEAFVLQVTGEGGALIGVSVDAEEPPHLAAALPGPPEELVAVGVG